MKTLYQKFAGWLWIGQRHYWLPIVWALVSFVVVNQPRVVEASWHRLMFPLALALIVPGGIAGLAIWIVVVAAIVAIVFVATKAMGVAIPGWVINVFWIVVIAIVCIAAIKLVAGL